MADASLHFDDAQFRQFVSKHPDDLILVDFYADWCPYCQMVGPILENIARDYKSKNVHIIKIDTDAATEVAQEYEVEVLPTLILLKGNQQLEFHTGAKDHAFLTSMIDKHLSAT